MRYSLKSMVWLAGLMVLLAGMAVSLAQPVPTPPCKVGSHPASPEEAISLSDQLAAALPNAVKQGEAMLIELPLNENSQPVQRIHFLNRDFPVYRQPNQTLISLVPVPVNHLAGSYMLSLQGPKKENLTSKAVRVVSAGYNRQNIRVSKSVGGIQPEPGELEAIARLKTDTNPEQKHWSPAFVSPTPDCMNSRFGNLRYHNGVFTGHYHKGIDLKSPMGRPVKAPTAGIVKIARKYRLHGGTVGLDHGQGLSSVYIHLSKILVQPGQVVQAGDVIGQVGSTGFATGPHLHWGVYANGQPINPLQWASDIKPCS